jgi:hypothetical protein
VAARHTLYRAHMGSDHEAEIRASVSARHDLGPGYDDAVAEGLVERIGAEIDKRIDARLGRPAEAAESAVPQGDPALPGYVPPGYAPPGYVAPGYVAPGYVAPGCVPPGYVPPGYVPPGYVPPGYVPAGYLPSGYHGHPGYPGYQGYQAPMPPGFQAPVPAARPTARSTGQRSVAMTVIALGSMTLGVAATAIVAHAQYGGQAVMVLLIWAAIAIVNIAYARRC